MPGSPSDGCGSSAAGPRSTAAPGAGGGGSPAASFLLDRLEDLWQALSPALAEGALHRIVDGDDALHATLLVHDWKGEQVVTRDGARHLIGIGVDRDGDRFRTGELAHRRVGVGDDEPAQGYGADQHSLAIGHIQVVDVV